MRRHLLSALVFVFGLGSEQALSASSSEKSLFGHHHDGDSLLDKIFGDHHAKKSPHPWTMNHEHDVDYALRKTKQKGISVRNNTQYPATIGLRGKTSDISNEEEITQVIPAHSSLELPEDLHILGMSKPAQSKKKQVFTNIKRNKGRIALFVEDQPKTVENLTPQEERSHPDSHCYGQFGRTHFWFEFNYLKDWPLHATRHNAHPAYIDEATEKVNYDFFDGGKFYNKFKIRQKTYEETDGRDNDAKEKSFKKLKKAEENWDRWVRDYIKDGSEERRIFLENDEIKYLQGVIRPFDRSYGPRTEKTFEELLEKRQIFDAAQSEEEKIAAFTPLFESMVKWSKWARQYNGNVWFLENLILKEAGHTRESYAALLNKQYEKHHPGQMYDYLMKHPIADGPDKIPPLTHTLWFTHPDKPVQFPYVDSLKRTTWACPGDQGFVHNFWILDPRVMESTLEALDSRIQHASGNFGAPVVVRQFDDEMRDSRLRDFVIDAAYNQKKFGLSTDAARAGIVEKFGGTYMDADFEALQSFRDYTKYYDFVGSIEPMSSYLGNAFFMAKPHHPILKEHIRIMLRNINPDTRPAYIYDVMREDPTYATISITGPGAFTEATASALGKHGNFDVVLPPSFFFPSVNNVYPERDVHKSTTLLNNTFPITAKGVHKWHTTWDQADYGSQG